MTPFDVIKDWSKCDDVDVFMDHVLSVKGQLPSYSDNKLKQVAKEHFNDRVCNTYKVIEQYLKKHRTDVNHSSISYAQKLKCFQQLSEKIEMLCLFAGSETSDMRKAREKVEKMIHNLEKLRYANDLTEIVLDLKKLGMPNENVDLITSQYHYIPFIQSTVNEVISLSKLGISNTEKISILLQNLSQFTLLVDGFLKKKEHISTTILAQLTLENFKSLSIIQAYLLGERLLNNEEDVKEITNQILQLIKNMHSPEALKEKRSDSPISSTAIQKQGALHEGIRQAAPWAAKQDQLDSLGTSVNKVFKLKNAEGTKTVAYYKESPDKGLNSEYMEQIMWDSAVVMGFEDQFVATANNSLRTKEHFKEDGKTVKTWSSTGELLEKNVNGMRKGGFQAIQEGVTLMEYSVDTNPNKIPIPHAQLVKGIFVSILFGFFDAHRGNILIDPRGNIKFFDNARSMPHSNGSILWGDSILKSSFRCGLLSLPETQAPLTPQDRQFIATQIEKSKVKYNELKKFYESRAIHSKISKLPKGWFQTQQVLTAMKERIQLLEAAALNPNIKTLCDLALDSQPNLRYHHAMSYLYRWRNYLPSEDVKDNYLNYMDCIGYTPLDICIIGCSEKGIDPQLIKQLCEDPNLSFEEVIARITTDYGRTFRIAPKVALLHADAIVQQLKSNSQSDFKDFAIFS